MEQVLTEHAFFHALFKILVSGSNDPHIGFHSRMTAHPVKMPIRQDSEQSRLKVKRHVTNFIQKQGAAIGLLKATSP